jgi:uncharacterized protein YdeI (YjbR/CyaY-like superfamily)
MEPRFFETPAAFRVWLAKNHDKETELLVGFHKRDTGADSITWPESVDEALCFGWIDAIRRSLGPTAYTIRFTRRKPTSTWSAINVARVEELTKLGRMHPAGLAAFARRRTEKTGIYAYERKDEAELAPEEKKAFAANRKAGAFFAARAPWYRRTALHWVVSAKRADTRERRLRQLVTDSAEGRTLAHLTRPATRPAAKKAKTKTKAT